MSDDTAPILAPQPKFTIGGAPVPAAPAARPAREALTNLQRHGMTAGELGGHDLAERRDAAQSVVHFRKPDGSVGVRDRTAADDQQGDGSNAAPDGTAKVAADLSIKDGKIKFGEMTFTEPELRSMMERHAAEDARKATLPDAPEKYEAKLPPDLQLPEGVEFAIDESSPQLADARRWAHENGIGQEKFSQLFGIYAAEKIRDAALLGDAQRAEREKLGALGTTRVTAVETFLRGAVGDELAGAMRPMIVSAKIVEGLEKLMARFSSQGAARFSQEHRAAEPQGVNEETWAAMSSREKQEYAQGHDQSRFRSYDGRSWQEPKPPANSGRRFG